MAAGIFAPLISGGLSLLGGFGAKQAAESQQKRQAINDAAARKYNEQAQHNVNMMNKELGERLLAEPYKETETQDGNVRTTQSSRGATQTDTTSAQDNYSFVDVKGMMQAAEDAGFNPVTWLNAGGMQAYTQTGSRGFSSTSSVSAQDDVTDSSSHQVTTKDVIGKHAAAAYALMSPEAALTTASQAVNIPSDLSILADAGKAAFNTYQQQAARDQSQAFQRDLLNRQLAAIQNAKAGRGRGNDGFGLTDADFLGPSQLRSAGSTGSGGYYGGSTAGAGGFQGTPSYATNGGARVDQEGSPLTITVGRSGIDPTEYAADGTPLPPPAPDSWNAGKKQEYRDPNNTGMEFKQPETLNPWQKMWGGAIRSDPDWPGGQAVEDKYGETPFITWPYGVANVINDGVYSLTGSGIDDHIMAGGQQVIDAGRRTREAVDALPSTLRNMGFVSPFFKAAGEPISIRPYIEESARNLNPASSVKAGPR